MKRFSKIFFSILLIIFLLVCIAWFGFLKPKPLAISVEDRARIALMPLPASLKLNDGRFLIDVNFGHTFQAGSSVKLQKALDRFYKKLEGATQLRFTKTNQTALIINCANFSTQAPSLEDQESYKLTIDADGIELSAISETGILYGLETLWQLVAQVDSQWHLPTAEITDQPRYPWRGLMIDVSRHWITKEAILRNLDAMAAFKMNVFHWHLTDFQGFRIESKVFPKLHEMGSEGNYYSQQEVKEIIDYANDLGIRVIPEFDIPGHSTSWLIGYPVLASGKGPYTLADKYSIGTPIMDPTKEEVYEFLDQFIGEMAVLFTDKYLHIGGDEAMTTEWEQNKSIQEYMLQNGIQDYHQLQSRFNIRINEILKKHGKKMMGWDEIIHPDLPEEEIMVQSWRSQKYLWEAARNNHKAILSAGYYLDHKRSAGFHYSVDPLVIPGAVTIAVDPDNWKSWYCQLEVKSMDVKLDGHLYFFGQGDDLRGISSFMGNTNAFEEVTIEADSSLNFELEGPVGKINYSLKISGDSIMGKARVSFIKIDIKGIRDGGSELDSGQLLPSFDKIKPLTTEQAANILGGEACMWSEMVSDQTLESRAWPRAAAIAEKLWSPQELTTDEKDMYRRLIVQDTKLIELGLMHHAGPAAILLGLAPDTGFAALKILVSLLQEDLLFNRMQIYEPYLSTQDPLNRIVDASQPESYLGSEFNQWVDLWLETKDPEVQHRLETSLTQWSIIEKELKTAFNQSPLLNEVEPHAIHLAQLSQLALGAINGSVFSHEPEILIDTLFANSSKSYGGTLLSVESGLKKIVQNGFKIEPKD
jgi:hexosaminidase